MTDPFASTADPFGGSDGTDPFGGSDGADPFDSATSTFVTAEDMDGRLLLIVPLRIEQRKGNDGDPFDAVFADVVVIDGDVTEKIGQVPGVLDDVMWSAGMVVSQLRSKVPTHRPVLGRLNSRPSKRNRAVRAYGLGDPTEQDKVLGRKAWVFYRQWDKARQPDPFN